MDEKAVLEGEVVALRATAREANADAIPFETILQLLEADELPETSVSLAQNFLAKCDAFMQGVSWRSSGSEDWLYSELGPRLHLYGLVEYGGGEEGAGPNYTLNRLGRLVVIALKAKRAGVALPFLAPKS
jgi:hypothetical protein